MSTHTLQSRPLAFIEDSMVYNQFSFLLIMSPSNIITYQNTLHRHLLRLALSCRRSYYVLCFKLQTELLEHIANYRFNPRTFNLPYKPSKHLRAVRLYAIILYIQVITIDILSKQPHCKLWGDNLWNNKKQVSVLVGIFRLSSTIANQKICFITSRQLEINMRIRYFRLLHQSSIRKSAFPPFAKLIAREYSIYCDESAHFH